MYERIRKELPELFELQNELNTQISPQWAVQNFPFYRAAMHEAAEAMEHFGWKWWKKQQPNMSQLKLEIVDIFHFVLSDRMQNSFNKGRSLTGDPIQIEMVASGYDRILDQKSHQNFLPILDDFIAGCGNKIVPVNHFWRLCFSLGIEWPELRMLYIGKQVLNTFRQDNGYKSGEYVKIWGYMEDNEHLLELLELAPRGANMTGDLSNWLYDHLKNRYQAQVLKGAA